MNSIPNAPASPAPARSSEAALWTRLRAFPWRTTAQTLSDRFREDRLGITAGSLTFTTMVSLVPLFTVALAIFSAFPMFGRMEVMLRQWLVQSLVPDTIARQVLNYLLQFSDKAGRLGWTGAAALLISALALILTIDRKLNDVWRVRKPRPLAQRVLVYWAALTLGPLALGASLSMTSYAVSASKGWVSAIPGGVNLLFNITEFAIAMFGLAALYRFVPHAQVRWAHALTGALLASIGLEVGKKVLTWYLTKVATYSAIYGAFATLPILLIWLYTAWVILLLGAVLTANLPSLLTGVERRVDTPGWRFMLALEALTALLEQKDAPARGCDLQTLAHQLRVDPLQLEEPLDVLLSLDWVARLDEAQGRYVLLADPTLTSVGPLVQRLLLPREPGTESLWAASRWDRRTLAEALPDGGTLFHTET